MLQHVTWLLLLLEIIASEENLKPRSVNIALETVLAFDNKNKATDVKFIDDVQSFLNKVRNVVDKKPARRAHQNKVNAVTFTEFVRELIEVLKSYENYDLEDIFAVIDEEIRKYHYKGCKFHELVKDHSLRRYVANKLNFIKEKPAKEIRWKLDRISQVLEDAKFDSTQTDVFDYINSLFTKDDSIEFKKTLDNLQNYKSTSKRANLNLVKLVRDSIRSIIFDKYSSLNPNARRDFKIKLETYWKHWNDPEKYNHKVWGSNIDSDPSRVLKVKKDMTRNKKDLRKSSNSNDHDNTSDKSESRDIRVIDLKKSSLSESEDFNSDEADSKEIKRQKKNYQDSTSSHDSNQDDAKDTVIQVTKEKTLHKKPKVSTPMFINIDIGEFVKLEKTKYPSLFTDRNSKSKKKQKYHKTSSYISLYPEIITTQKRRLKIETSTKRNNIKMQTLWQEKLKHKHFHHNDKQSHDTQYNSYDFQDTTIDTEIPVSMIQNQKKRSNPKGSKVNAKHRHRKGKMRNNKKLRSQYDTKLTNLMHKKYYEKSEHLQAENIGFNNISFKRLPPKYIREHNSQKAHKQYKSSAEQNHIQKPTQGQYKRADTSTEADLYIGTHPAKVHKSGITTKKETKPIHRKYKTVKKTESDSTEKLITFAKISQKFADSLSETEEFVTENIGAHSKTRSILQGSTGIESDSVSKNFQKSLEEESTCESDDEVAKSIVRKHSNYINKNKVQDIHFSDDDIFTNFKAKTQSNEETTQRNPKYKMLDESVAKKSITIYRGRHKMVDNTAKMITVSPNITYTIHKNTKGSFHYIKMAEKSTEYEAEEIISKNLYSKPTTNKTSSYILNHSEEGLSIESFGSKLTKSYRKSNYFDNFNPSTGNVMQRIDLTYEPNTTKNKVETINTKADIYSLQKKRYPTLPFWVGTTKNTKVIKTTEPLMSTYTFTRSSTHTLPTNTNNIIKPNYTGETLEYWSSSPKSTVPIKNYISTVLPTTITEKTIIQSITTKVQKTYPNTNHENKVTITLSSKTDNETPSINTLLRNSAEIQKKYSIQDYINRSIQNLERYKANANKPKYGLTPFRSINTNTYFSNINLPSTSYDDVSTTPSTTFKVLEKNSTISQQNNNMSNYDKSKPHSALPNPDITSLPDKASVTGHMMNEIEQIMSKYGLSSISPLGLNILRNNSVSRKNMPSDKHDSNTDRSKQELDSDLEEIDNLLEKYEFSPKKDLYEEDKNKTGNASAELDVSAQVTKSINYEQFHHFLTNTTKGRRRKSQKKIKDQVKFKADIQMPVKYNDAMKPDNITDYDIDVNFDLL